MNVAQRVDEEAMAPRSPRRSDRTRSGPTRWTSRLRGERGASLPEYALLVALLAVPSVAGIDALRSGAGDTAQGTADRISDPTIPTVPPTSSTAPPATTTTTTTTTTTMPPTTTTTTAPASQLVSTLGAVSTSTASSPRRWSAQTTVTIRNERGALVSGASVTIRVQYRKGSDSWQTAPNLSGTTNGTGVLLLDSGFYNSSGSSQVDQIRFQVTSVTKSGMTWQTDNTRVTASRPN